MSRSILSTSSGSVSLALFWCVTATATSLRFQASSERLGRILRCQRISRRWSISVTCGRAQHFSAYIHTRTHTHTHTHAHICTLARTHSHTHLHTLSQDLSLACPPPHPPHTNCVCLGCGCVPGNNVRLELYFKICRQAIVHALKRYASVQHMQIHRLPCELEGESEGSGPSNQEQNVVIS